MEGLSILIAIIGLLVILGVLADRFGVDSRLPNLDDWARPVTS